MTSRSFWLSASWSESILFHSESRSIPDRIVSLYQDHIRPIVRGNARCNVEFGAKILISVTGNGFTIRSNRAFCQRHDIRLTGPRLGRPKKDPEILAVEKKQFIDDQRQRNAV